MIERRTRPDLRGSYWPSEEQRRLLRACFLPGEEGLQAWRDLQGELDIEKLEFGTMVLLPLLYERLLEWDADGPVSRLKGVYRYVWYRNQLALNALGTATTVLNAVQVESIAMGGSALVARHYDRLGVRPVEVAELLVPADQLPHAGESLEEHGWTQTSDEHGGVFTLAERGYSCALRSSLPAGLDVLASPGLRELVWLERESLEIHDVPSHVSSAAHELLFTIAAGARTGGSRVQWIADAMTILSSTVNWSHLYDAAVDCGIAMRVRNGLRYLVEELRAPVPPSVIAELEDVPVSRRQRVAHWIGDRGEAMGNLPPTLESHMLATRHESIAHALRKLPDRLCDEWGVDTALALPAVAVRKSASAVANARLRRSRHESLHTSA